MNLFVHEIDVARLQARIGRVYEQRVAQLAQKGYEEHTRKMYAAVRQARAQFAIAEGNDREDQQPMTPKEQAALNTQRQARFRDLSPGEQTKLHAEIDAMWAGIPEHVRGKALKLIS